MYETDCINDSSHNRNEPFVGILHNGALTAGCHHKTCTWNWADFRKHYEPGYRARALKLEMDNSNGHAEALSGGNKTHGVRGPEEWGEDILEEAADLPERQFLRKKKEFQRRLYADAGQEWSLDDLISEVRRRRQRRQSAAGALRQLPNLEPPRDDDNSQTVLNRAGIYGETEAGLGNVTRCTAMLGVYCVRRVIVPAAYACDPMAHSGQASRHAG